MTRIDWENPHVLFVNITGPDGSVVNWACETGRPTRLARRGWARDSLKPGDNIIVHCYRTKDASHAADGQQGTLAYGRRIGFEPRNGRGRLRKHDGRIPSTYSDLIFVCFAACVPYCRARRMLRRTKANLREKFGTGSV
jgi:hypothetical protein